MKTTRNIAVADVTVLALATVKCIWEIPDHKTTIVQESFREQ